MESNFVVDLSMSNPHIHNKSYLDDLHTSLAYLLTDTKHLHSGQNKIKLHRVHTQWMSVQYWRIYEATRCTTQQNVQRHDKTFFSVTSCFWAHTASDLIMVNCMWPPSVENYLKYWFTYNNQHCNPIRNRNDRIFSRKTYFVLSDWRTKITVN